MHDLDRVLDPETGLDDEFAAGYDGELETTDFGDEEPEGFEGDFEGDFEADFEGDTEGDFEGDFEEEMEVSGMPFTEEEELALASELLTVEGEEELDLFLGKLMSRARKRLRKLGSRVKRIARPLGRVLRPFAKRLLPIAGRAVGTFFGGPVGGALGARAASFAGKTFGLELEGLAPEEQELEVARRFVRLAGTAAAAAARVPTRVSPDRAARIGVRAAARQQAPGLLRRGGPRQRTGRWIRRGNRVVLFGV